MRCSLVMAALAAGSVAPATADAFCGFTTAILDHLELRSDPCSSPPWRTGLALSSAPIG